MLLSGPFRSAARPFLLPRMNAHQLLADGRCELCGKVVMGPGRDPELRWRCEGVPDLVPPPGITANPAGYRPHPNEDAWRKRMRTQRRKRLP